MTDQEKKTLLGAQQGELDAVLMYQALAKAAKAERDKTVFLTLAAEEGHHAAVFKALTNTALAPKKRNAALLTLLYRLIGRKRLYPLIARGEYAAARNYQPLIDRFPPIESVKNDETRHGDMVAQLLR